MSVSESVSGRASDGGSPEWPGPMMLRLSDIRLKVKKKARLEVRGRGDNARADAPAPRAAAPVWLILGRRSLPAHSRTALRDTHSRVLSNSVRFVNSALG